MRTDTVLHEKNSIKGTALKVSKGRRLTSGGSAKGVLPFQKSGRGRFPDTQRLPGDIAPGSLLHGRIKRAGSNSGPA